VINLCLAIGHLGREGAGCAMITGQGNGQGGREHGQKCDQLPGSRDIDNPEHRRHMAAIWDVAEADLPHAGVDVYEMFRKVEQGEIRGLLSWSINPMVSLPDSAFIKRMLEKLEFFACVDFFLSETARFADVVLPGSQHEEDEGVVCSTEGRVIKINQAVRPPGDARQDWRILQDVAKALGRERGFDEPTWTPRPVRASISTRQCAYKYDRRQHDTLNPRRGDAQPLSSSMPPGDMRHVEQRRSFRRTTVQHLEHRLKVHVEIDYGLHDTLKHEGVVSIIPPAVH